MLHQSWHWLADEARSTAWTDAAPPTKHAAASAAGWWASRLGNWPPTREAARHADASLYAPWRAPSALQAGLIQLVGLPVPHTCSTRCRLVLGANNIVVFSESFLIQLLADLADHPC